MKTMKFSEAEVELLEEHAKRYGETLKVSVGAAFAALFFLLQFESRYMPPNNPPSDLLKYTWACFLISALLGTQSLAIWVVRPKKRLAELNIVRDQNDRIVEVKIGSLVPWYESLSFWGHVASFLAGSVWLSYIKFTE